MEKKNNIEIENKIWKIFDQWRNIGVTPYQAMRVVLFILTIKKIIEDRENINSDNIQKIMDLQRGFYTFREQYNDVSVFQEVGAILENRYNIPKGLFDNYFGNVNGENKWNETFQNSLRMANDLESIEKIDNLSEIIEKIIFKSISTQGGRQFISSNTMADLLKIVLNVCDEDTFCDGTIGFGISAMRCVNDTNSLIWGMDLNVEILQITTLYFVLSGKKHFELKIGDFTLDKICKRFDKIAMDIPLGVKIGGLIGEQIKLSNKWMDSVACREMDALFVSKAMEALKENGRAAIVVPNGFLFRTNKAGKILKRNIIENKMLKMVIELPPLHYGTRVKCSIIVLEKSDDKILFIDMSRNDGEFFQKQRRDIPALSSNGKDKLIDIISKKQKIKGISYVAEMNEIEDKNFDLSPSIYVSVHEEKKYRKVEEINNEIKNCYEELTKINKENTEMKLFN